MCGIAGVFLSAPKERISEKLLTEMIHKIKHRGPDVQQVLSLEGIGLAHARLSIIDLHENANQPMIDPDTGNIIVFNGEIYNYLEIKRELEELGVIFDTQGDTEVILKAYARWGYGCLNKFNGMWGFVLYDAKRKLIFASRDRLGVKPLVYGITQNNSLVFASEAKAIVTTFPEFKRVNKDFLINFVERDFFACYKETFYQGLFNLLPGHYFVIEHGERPVQKRYWEWKPHIENKKKSDKHILEEFKGILTDSIRLRFRSDVPVGSCLSGGIDSGTIVGLATEMFNKPLETFSCVFPNSPEFDESEYIKASVQKFRSNPHYTEPSHEDFIQLMRDSVYEQDGPTGGASVLSQRAVMELAGKHVKVVLDGQGADELLGGYHSYFYYSLKSHVRDATESFSVRSVMNYMKSSAQIRRRTGANIVSGHQLYRAVRTSPVKFMSSNLAETQLGYMEEFEDDDLNTLLLEHVFTNLTNLLHYEDRNSMRFSIESRLPYLDYRLVEYAFSLCHRYKIRGSQTKWLLTSIAKDVLPDEVLSRKDKMGFTTPAHKWFHQKNDYLFFKKYFDKSNMIFGSLPEYWQNHLLKSYEALSKLNSGVVTPATAPDMNGLWRFFTANLWYEENE